jgi:prepilin-type N-terminal cleavage/methylation domain-containing protein
MPRLTSQRGFTFLELLVSMAIGSLLSLTAFGLIITTRTSGNRINEQIHIDQTARVALENLMRNLHSACVVPEKPPVQSGSTESTIRFVSATGQEAAVTPVLHEVLFTAPKEELKERLYEANAGSTYGSWTFNASPATERRLATGIQESTEQVGATERHVPVFRYYEYYQENPTTHVNPHPGELETEYLAASGSGLNTELAENVSKVTVAFRAAPIAAHEPEPKATVLEDSVLYRLTPTSVEESASPEPCA